jgi:hypothetical protein
VFFGSISLQSITAIAAMAGMHDLLPTDARFGHETTRTGNAARSFRACFIMPVLEMAASGCEGTPEIDDLDEIFCCVGAPLQNLGQLLVAIGHRLCNARDLARSTS